MRFHLIISLGAALCLGASAVFAQAIPWYLGAPDPAERAPSSIQTYSIPLGPAPVVVAVIDSGVIAGHPSLAGRLLSGYDMVSSPSNLRGGRSANFAPDERGATCGEKLVSGSFRTHGTEVSSVIAGNGVDGMVGVDPKAKILPIRVFGACGMSVQDLGDAIQWAIGLPVNGLPENPTPARIVNISISGGSPRCSPQLQQVIDRAIEKNVFIVVAAGNNFNRPMAQPANCHGVISVGALSAENVIEKYSALDPRISIYSPGGGPSLASGRSWMINKIRIATYEPAFMGGEKAVVADKGIGTSFAAPIVSGYIALLLSHRPDINLAQWQAEFEQNVRPVKLVDSKCSDCFPRGLAANIKNIIP